MEARIDRLEGNMDRLMDGYANIREELGGVQSTLKALVESFADLKKQLLGNGQPGRLDRMETRLSANERMVTLAIGAIAVITFLANALPPIISLVKKL